MQLIRYHSRRSLLLRQSSTTSTDSCFSANTLLSGKSGKSTSFRKQNKSHKRCRRQVCFAEDENEVYFNHDDLEDHEIQAAWYSEQEIDAMRNDTDQLAAHLLQTSDARKRKIQRAYRSFCGGAADVDLILQSCQYICTDMPLGMEKYLLLPRERELRNTRLHKIVQYWTTTIDCRESDRYAKLRGSCERESRPNRLFAFYTAMSTAVACAAVEQENDMNLPRCTTSV